MLSIDSMNAEEFKKSRITGTKEYKCCVPQECRYNKTNKRWKGQEQRKREVI